MKRRAPISLVVFLRRGRARLALSFRKYPLQRHYGEVDVDWGLQIRRASACVEDYVGGYPECVPVRSNVTVKFDCGDAAGLLLCVIEKLERAAGRIDGIAL